MTLPRRLSTTQRRALYDSALAAAIAAGREHPACNLCPHPILPGQLWEDSHFPVPAALDGTERGIAHKRCNRIHGAQVVVPMVAKVKRISDKFRDIKRTRNPLPGGREDPRKRTMGGQVVARATGGKMGRHSIMRSVIVKHSIIVAGQRTAISLEPDFWNELKRIHRVYRDERPSLSLSALVSEIDLTRGRANLSSAVRLFVLRDLRSKAFPVAAVATQPAQPVAMT